MEDKTEDLEDNGGQIDVVRKTVVPHSTTAQKTCYSLGHAEDKRRTTEDKPGVFGGQNGRFGGQTEPTEDKIR